MVSQVRVSHPVIGEGIVLFERLARLPYLDHEALRVRPFSAYLTILILDIRKAG